VVVRCRAESDRDGDYLVSVTAAGQSLAQGVKLAYQQHVDYRKEAALRMWVAFIVTFIFLRALTFGIRYNLLPIHNVVTKSGLHIHHFVWGIFLLLLVGFLGLVLEQARWHPRIGIIFGIAAALIIDEFALWLNLQDVYWATAGRSSIDLAIVVAALLGLYYAANHFWNQVVREAGMALSILRRGEQRLERRRQPKPPTTVP
jgi:hypothetical protein